MPWISEALDRLAASHCGYHNDLPQAAEPTALAALAFAGAGRIKEAQAALGWLGSKQVSDGSVPPLPTLDSPGWPTPQAMLAWAAVSKLAGESRDFDRAAAQKWLLSIAGLTGPRIPEIGHDTSLAGWPWVVGTHSWQEPTAWSVLALRAVGLNDHPRTREGVRMLVDRFLENGGCNYGNTTALGQVLRPHVEPTGLTLVALAGENIQDARLEKSLKFLEDSISAQTTPISLSYGLLGLTAHDRRPSATATWLETVYRRSMRRQTSSPLSLALLVLAAQGKNCPLIQGNRVSQAASPA